MDDFIHATRRNIPNELIDSIIDYNHSDPPTLLASALVSKKWIPASRYHVFSNINISHENAQEFMQLVRSPNCTFCGILRGLNVHFAPGSQRWFSEFLRRLSSVDRINVTSLMLSGTRNTAIRDEVVLALSTYFAQVKHFRVGTVVFESFTEFATILRNFRALESLSCAATFQLATPADDIQFAARLQSLDLISPSIGPIFNFLLVQGALPTIALLSLSHPVIDDYNNLTTYFSTSNEILQSLSIRMDSTFSGVTIDEFTERINMGQLRALRNLVIDTTPAMSPDQAFALLTTISSSQLTKIKVALQLVQGVARMDILFSGGHFLAIHELVILRASWDEVRQFLPRCDARGILREV
ncbi:hypothetical protein BDN70DRAFT_505561 [Pholiota conissans]|uniref:F-box domain-containing protein n=1 Tax=Pholiota conissans TaxID=109636 RepID=A0A9P5Z671_9AGAR|nr:hypothetical protein BDN70DRAFT_505561 [Pholiota conissans]